MDFLAQTATLLSRFPGYSPETLPQTDYVPPTVTLSRRELSLIVERLLMAAGCPKGMWAGTRDFALEAIATLKAPALDSFEAAIEDRDPEQVWNPGKITSSSEMRFAGEPIMLVGEFIVDALLAHLADSPSAPFFVSGLGALDGYQGIAVRCRYFGIEPRFEIDELAGSIVISARPRSADPSSDLVQLLKHGVVVSGATWWRLYQPSNFALSEETELSRAHTGVSETLIHYSM